MPPFLQQGLTNLFQQGEATSSIPYSAYPGPRNAPLSSQQQSGIGQAAQYSQAAQPWLQQAGQYAGQSTTPIAPTLQSFGQNQFNQFGNPFTQNVTQTAEQELQRQLAIGQQGVAGQAAQQGAWGGDRAAIAQSELARNEGQLGGQLAAQLGLQNWQQAQGEFNTEQNRQFAAQETDAQRQAQAAQLMSGIGAQVQGQGIQGAEALMGTGALEQQNAQAGLNTAYNDFLQQRNWPFQQLQTLSGVVQGFPTNAFAGSTQTSPGPSAFSQIGGAGLAGLGIAGSLGAFGGGGGGGSFPAAASSGIYGGGMQFGGAYGGGYFSTGIHKDGGATKADGGGIGGQGGSPSKRYAFGGGMGSSGFGADLGQFSHMPKIPAGFGSHMGSVSAPKFRPAFRAMPGKGGSITLRPRALGYFKRGGVAAYDQGGQTQAPTYDAPNAMGPDAKSLMAAKAQQVLQGAAPSQRQQLQRSYAMFDPYAVQNVLNIPRVPGASGPMGQAAQLGMPQAVYTGQADGGIAGFAEGGVPGGQGSETQKILRQAEGSGTSTTTGGGGSIFGGISQGIGDIAGLIKIGSFLAGLQNGGIAGYEEGGGTEEDYYDPTTGLPMSGEIPLGRGWTMPSVSMGQMPTLPPSSVPPPAPSAEPGIAPSIAPSLISPAGAAPAPVNPGVPPDHQAIPTQPVATTTPAGVPVRPPMSGGIRPVPRPSVSGAPLTAPSGQPIGASDTLMDAAMAANTRPVEPSQSIGRVGQGDQGQQQQPQGYQPNPWLALAAAGAGMMASPSKFAGRAIGQGMQAGLGELDRQRQLAAQDQLRRAQLQGMQQWHQGTIDARLQGIQERADAAAAASQDRRLSIQQRQQAAQESADLRRSMITIAQQNADTRRDAAVDRGQARQDRLDHEAALASQSLTERMAPKDLATGVANPNDPGFRVQHDSYILRNYPESQQGRVIKSQLGVPMPLPAAADGKPNPAFLMPGQVYQTAKGNAKWTGNGFEPLQ